MSIDFASAGNVKTILLTTYKRDGTGVRTPVSIAFGDGRVLPLLRQGMEDQAPA